MCGIVGMISKNGFGFSGNDDDIFQDMLYTDAIRGMDSTGAFVVTKKNQVTIVKQAVDPGILFRTKSWKDFKTDINSKGLLVVGHNRKATTGAITSKNAHPFEKNGVILVHNGFISNAKQLDSTVDVDSESILTALTDNKQDVIKTLDSLNGAWALAWYNHTAQKFYLARNPERPLSFVHSENKVFFASEPPMLSWMLDRHGKKHDKIVMIDPWKVWEITVGTNFAMKELQVGEKNSTVWFPSRPSTGTFSLEGDMCGLQVPWEDPAEDKSEETTHPLQRPGDRDPGKLLQAPAVNDLDENKMERYTTETKELLHYYKIGSLVFFHVEGFSELDGGKMVSVRGKIWRPGRPVYNGVWNIDASKDKELYHRHVRLAGRVDMLSRRGDDLKVMLKDVYRPGDTLEDFDKTEMFGAEWTDICNNLGCGSCAKPLNKLRPELTKIRRDVKNPEAVYDPICDECVTNQHEGNSNAAHDKPSVNG